MDGRLFVPLRPHLLAKERRPIEIQECWNIVTLTLHVNDESTHNIDDEEKDDR